MNYVTQHAQVHVQPKKGCKIVVIWRALVSVPAVQLIVYVYSLLLLRSQNLAWVAVIKE